MKFCGDAEFTKHCNQWLESTLSVKKALLTTSCTHALEMAALLTGITSGDEVIVPSYTFVSTANAFVMRGAKVIFVDIRPDTMNIDETLIESAISSKTKAIVPVHYAGVGCEMDTITALAKKYNLFVIEDAAQSMMAKYKGTYLGSIGDIGAFSYHETKNYQCGEGGALIINNDCFSERSEIIREKGTNRAQFYKGHVDKYTWCDLGSSYLPSDLNAAFLLAQLEMANEINKKRLSLWNTYFEELSIFQQDRKLELPIVPSYCEHNAHMFYIKVANINERDCLINHLKKNDVQAVFHYIPLHSSPAGKKFGEFHGNDIYTTKESERLLRLPLYYELTIDTVKKICQFIKLFYS